jgi:HEAT repeat protein
VNWDADVAPLLQHPSPSVRVKAIQHLGRTGNDDYAHTISALLFEPEQTVRAAAVEALYAIMVDPETGTATISYIAPFLTDANPRVKGTAIVGLLNYGDPNYVQRATAELKRMLTGDIPALRQEAARIIGLATAAEQHILLASLFDDPSLEVRLDAIRAAGTLNSRELLPHLIRKLRDKTTAAAAVEALIKYKDAIEPELSAALDDPGSSVQVPRILETRRTRSAVDILLSHFFTADEAVRGEVYRALARLRAGGFEFYLSESGLREAIIVELRGGYALIATREDLGKGGLDLLLADAFQIRLSRAIDRVFFLLNLLYPTYTRQIQRVRQALEAEPSNTRALAIELLDALAERQVKELLLPLVEAPVEQLLEIARKRFDIAHCSPAERLAQLAQSPDLWLRTCAVFRIGVLKQAELSESVLAALEADDALLRETALVASRSLFDSQRFAELLATHADDDFPVVRRYAQAQLEIRRFA